MADRYFLAVLLFLIPEIVCSQDTIRVLHYTETTGYDHNTRTESKNLFERICDSLTANTPYIWVLTHSDASEVFDDLSALQKYKAVVWSNTTGDDGLTSAQCQSYEQYVHAGGNYLGIHAASDTYRHSSSNGDHTGTWDFYAENMSGASVQTNPHHTSVDHHNTIHHTAAHPILSGIPNPWHKTEEYYYWENGYVDSSFTQLLRVNTTGSNSYDSARMVAHYKEHSWGSRSFYTSLGHAVSNYTSDADFERLLKNALYWVANPSPPANIAIRGKAAISFYPNPFTQTLTLNIPDKEPYTIAVFDISGRAAYTGLGQGNTTIDLSHLRKGVYYLTLTNRTQVYTKRIIKN